MSPGALDLLEKMLIFDPNKRITGSPEEFEFQAQLYKLLIECNFLYLFFILSVMLIYLQLMRHCVTRIFHPCMT